MSLRPDRGPEAGRHWSGPAVVGIGTLVDDWLLDAAAEEAADRRCGVRLVHVRHDPIAIYGQADIAVPVRRRESESQAHERLIASRDRLLSIAPAEALIAVQLVTETGDVAAGIARHCGDASVAMIGVDRGSNDHMPGRIALALAAASPAPVLLTVAAPRVGPVVLAASPRGLSPAAVAAAFGEAARRGTSVRAVRVLPHRTLDLELAHGAAAQEEAEVAQMMAGHAEDWPDVPVEVSVHLGPVEHVLLRQSEAASLMVMGTRARGPVSGSLLGSATVALIRRSRCALMIVPSRPGD